MFKLGKTRGLVWSAPMPSDPEVAFEVAPLTPKVTEDINNRFFVAQYEQTPDGASKITTTVKSSGMSREQAKAVVRNWKGIVDDDGNPIPCTPAMVDLLFDVWDDGGAMAAHVVTTANKFNEIQSAAKVEAAKN